MHKNLTLNLEQTTASTFRLQENLLVKKASVAAEYCRRISAEVTYFDFKCEISLLQNILAKQSSVCKLTRFHDKVLFHQDVHNSKFLNEQRKVINRAR